MKALILLSLALPAFGAYHSCLPWTIAQQSGAYPYGFNVNYTDSRLATVANNGWAISSNGYDIVFAADSLGANLLQWDALSVYSATTGQIATHVGQKTTSTASVSSGTQTITPGSMVWISVGTQLTFDTYASGVQETKTVTAATGTTFTVTLTNAHAANFVIAVDLSSTGTTPYYICVGNPTISTFQGGSTGASQHADIAAYYTLGSGSTVSGADSTANANTFTIGSPVAGAGVVGGGVSTCGLSCLNAADSASLHPTDLTFMFWMKPNSITGNGGCGGTGFCAPFFKSYTSSAPFGGYFAQINGTTGNQYRFIVGSGTQDAVVTVTVPDLNWHHYATTFNHTTGVETTYMDGVSQGTGIMTGCPCSIFTNPTGLYLGSPNGAILGWGGGLDEVIVSSAVWTAAEVATLYANQSMTINSANNGFLTPGIWSNSGYLLTDNTWPYKYNDQFAGANYWPSTGGAARGDSPYSTWDSNGNVYMSFNDGQGPAASGGIPSGGCNNGSGGGANAGIGVLSANLKTWTIANCMSSWGYQIQTNTGGFTDSSTSKSQGMAAINDGVTNGGVNTLYWIYDRQLDSPPYTVANETIMVSTNQGASWCNPANCPTMNANGDQPQNTAQFTGTWGPSSFVQYEQGGTGTLNVDCNPSYIYVYFGNNARTNFVLGRIARGSALNSGLLTNSTNTTNWSFYNGSIGGSACTSGNWTSLATSGTQILNFPNISTTAFVYIGGTVGYLLAVADSTNNISFYTSPTVTGSWAKMPYWENGTTNGGPYSGPQPLLHTLKAITGGYTIEVVMTGNFSRDTTNSSTPYSPFFRLLTITNGPTAWLPQ